MVAIAHAARSAGLCEATAGTRVRLDRRMRPDCWRHAATVSPTPSNFRGEPWLPGNDLLTRYPGDLRCATSHQIVARARACIGARFRPHGRDPRFGLDCVGRRRASLSRGTASCGLSPASCADVAAAEAGDRRDAGLRHACRRCGCRMSSLLMRGGGDAAPPGRADRDVGFVHADTGICARVVETPGAPPWRISFRSGA